MWHKLLVLGLSLGALRGSAIAEERRPSPRDTAPSLVVVLVVDGLRYADLEKWRPQFGPGGFRRLLEGGKAFDAARYPYATTQTCAGHATVMTGAVPAKHGIISNSWFDRDAGKKVGCSDDAAHPTLEVTSGAEVGVSPQRLLVPTLGDVLLASTASSRVLGISLKDRAAAMLAGQRGTAFYWGDTGFTTSTYYAKQVPEWVRIWNKSRPRMAGRTWDKIGRPALYAGLGPDDDARERPPAGFGRVFPHPIKSEDAVPYTPLGAELLFDFSLEAVRANQLGTRPGANDLLAVGISTVDLISHAYGPESHEALDTLLRLDRSLATFLAALDKQVGREHVLVALTADHGMTSAPRSDQERVSGDAVRQTAESALVAAFGAGHWVQAFTAPNLYLDHGELEHHHVRVEDAARICAKSVLQVHGVASAWVTADPKLREAGSIGAMVARSVVAGRSGDLVVIPTESALLAPDADSASWHGTPYEHDIHVPLVLAGPGISAGRVARPVTPADLAPTLAPWLGIKLPDATGAPLNEALPERAATKP